MPVTLPKQATEEKSEIRIPYSNKVYIPSITEQEDLQTVSKAFVYARNVVQKSYNQFNGRTLTECIDDWEKRWNGYIPAGDTLLTDTQSRMFLNFTRNQIESYLSKVALQQMKIKVKAVNKKNGIGNRKLAQITEDLNEYSSDEENGDARFLDTALETTVKGTAIVYEGYAKQKQKMPSRMVFDPITGKVSYALEDTIIFDNCFQHCVRLNDFFFRDNFCQL